MAASSAAASIWSGLGAGGQGGFDAICPTSLGTRDVRSVCDRSQAGSAVSHCAVPARVAARGLLARKAALALARSDWDRLPRPTRKQLSSERAWGVGNPAMGFYGHPRGRWRRLTRLAT